MNVIKIPSKNIFSYENQKVLQNRIDRIEATVYDTTSKTHTIEKSWSFGDSPLLVDNIIEETATITSFDYEVECTPWRLKKADTSSTIFPSTPSAPSVEGLKDGYAKEYGTAKKYGRTITRPYSGTITLADVGFDFNGDQGQYTAYVYLKMEMTNRLRANIYYDNREIGADVVGFDLSYIKFTFYVTGVQKDTPTVVVSIPETEQGQKSKNVLNLQQSDLMQTETKSEDNKTVYEHILQNLTAKYKNGREFVTLKCSISDYFDDNGEIAIDASGKNGRMFFDIGDVVIPYKPNELHQDVPVAADLYGNPKRFLVVKRDISYDGAVFQTIRLAEYKDEGSGG